MRFRTARFLAPLSLAAAVFLSVLCLEPRPGWTLAGDSEKAFGLDGSLRTVGALFRNYGFPPLFGTDNKTDEYSQTILRLTAAGRPGNHLSYEIHLVQSYSYFSGRGAPGSGAFGLVAGKSRYRALDETWDWLTDQKTTARLWLDRFNLKIALPRADITIGRQALTFGKAYFGSPLDVFLPFDPRQFDRDYKAGVDALRVDLALGDFSGFTLAGVLGRELDLAGAYTKGDKTWRGSWAGSSLLARFFTNVRGWDLAVQGGKVYGGCQIGGGLAGEISGLELRGEAAFFWAKDSPPLPQPLQGDLLEDHFTGVAGLGHRFENTLVIEFEYLFNGGGGESEDLNQAWVRFQHGDIIHLGRHLAGLMVSYDILPILIGQAALIYSLTDSSAQVQPSLTWSLSGNADLLLGASLNLGRRPQGDSALTVDLRSEFGAYPDFYFAEFKFYF